MFACSNIQLSYFLCQTASKSKGPVYVVPLRCGARVHAHDLSNYPSGHFHPFCQTRKSAPQSMQGNNLKPYFR